MNDPMSVAMKMNKMSRAKNLRERISSELLNTRISMNLNRLKNAVTKNARVMAVSISGILCMAHCRV